MKYQGSKNRLHKYLLPIILKNRKSNQCYVEPFVGGANLIDKVDNPRIGSDIHEYLICFLKAVQNDWLPPNNISEDLYKEIQKNKNSFPKELVGYVGFQLSYGGKWFGGYRRDKIGNRDYSLEAFNNTVKQASSLKGIEFHHCSYEKLNIPDNSIIYCDPEYEGTTKYSGTKFNHKDFWEWCRLMSQKGHSVFISEYNSPQDFKCIWQKEINSSLTKNTGSKKGIEKLFVYER